MKRWQGHDRFLKALRRTGNVDISAQLAGVTRMTVYRHRRTDYAFRRAWDEALGRDSCNGLAPGLHGTGGDD